MYGKPTTYRAACRTLPSIAVSTVDLEPLLPVYLHRHSFPQTSDKPSQEATEPQHNRSRPTLTLWTFWVPTLLTSIDDPHASYVNCSIDLLQKMHARSITGLPSPHRLDHYFHPSIQVVTFRSQDNDIYWRNISIEKFYYDGPPELTSSWLWLRYSFDEHFWTTRSPSDSKSLYRMSFRKNIGIHNGFTNVLRQFIEESWHLSLWFSQIKASQFCRQCRSCHRSGWSYDSVDNFPCRRCRVIETGNWVWQFVIETLGQRLRRWNKVIFNVFLVEFKGAGSLRRRPVCSYDGSTRRITNALRFQRRCSDLFPVLDVM